MNKLCKRNGTPANGRGVESTEARYRAFFDCFNLGHYYEAHDVLEGLWLPERLGSNGAFYKGLIQLAGAFVHLQRHTEQRPRLRPAAALMRLARANLQPYPSVHERLPVDRVLGLIGDWLGRLESGRCLVNPLPTCATPKLQLLEDSSLPKGSQPPRSGIG